MKLKYLNIVVRSLALCVVCAVVISCTSTPRHGKSPIVIQKGDAVPKAEAYTKGANPSSYVVRGKKYYVHKTHHGYKERGTASWYGKQFHGKKTANAEKYDMYTMTAAHKSLPLPSYVKVTNLENKKTVVVRVNDRGPFHSNRIIDLSYAAAKKLGMDHKGTAKVEVEAISVGKKPIVLAENTQVSENNSSESADKTSSAKSKSHKPSMKKSSAKKSSSKKGKNSKSHGAKTAKVSGNSNQKKAVLRTASR